MAEVGEVRFPYEAGFRGREWMFPFPLNLFQQRFNLWQLANVMDLGFRVWVF